MNKLTIIWSNQAKTALKSIYGFYKEKSIQGAENVKSDLLKAPKTIPYSGQYQVDDINPNYRRIVVRDYKILYKEEGSVIQILDIVCTNQSPEILEKE
jgi:plasmid stabilization system protein ParE